MRVHAHACMYMYVHTCMHPCEYVHVCVYAYTADMEAWFYTCMHIYLGCMRSTHSHAKKKKTYVRVCVCVCVCVCVVCVNMNLPPKTNIHENTHTSCVTITKHTCGNIASFTGMRIWKKNVPMHTVRVRIASFAHIYARNICAQAKRPKSTLLTASCDVEHCHQCILFEHEGTIPNAQRRNRRFRKIQKSSR